MRKKIQKSLHKISMEYKILMGIWIGTGIVYGLSWKMKGAVDFYKTYIFPITTGGLAGFSSIFPFSLGEILIVAGILFLLLGVGILLLFLWKRNSVKVRKAGRLYFHSLLWILSWILVTETANCFVVYHATTVEEEKYGNHTFQQEELIALYNEVAEKCNTLSTQMERTENEAVVYDGDMEKDCKAAMKKLGEQFPYLKGYYPNPKQMINSDLMSQMYLCGIYFPFTMEANYNTTMYIMNQPATICHELSHTKGVILEDEANFFGFAACIESGNPFLEYSGYLSVLPYIAREVRKTIPEDVREAMQQVNETVVEDAVFLTRESWDKVEKKAVVSTNTANQAADAFLEKNLTVNGVKDGMVSYSRVVRLLLDYYHEENKEVIHNN